MLLRFETTDKATRNTSIFIDTAFILLSLNMYYEVIESCKCFRCLPGDIYLIHVHFSWEFICSNYFLVPKFLFGIISTVVRCGFPRTFAFFYSSSSQVFWSQSSNGVYDRCLAAVRFSNHHNCYLGVLLSITFLFQIVITFFNTTTLQLDLILFSFR